MSPPGRHALVVATQTYEDPGLVALRAPADDARAVQQVLEDPAIGDFTVRTLIDGRSYEAAEEVEAFFADQHRDSLLLVYFSCHGVKDEDGRLYFAGRNTKLGRLAATGLSAQFVEEQMQRCRSRRIVLLLDCCYSGAFGRLGAKAAQNVDVTDRLSGRGRIVITASTAMEYAFEGGHGEQTGAGSSVFTRALVTGLSTGRADLDGDGRVSVDDLYEYVFDEVRAVTPHQTPSMRAEVEGAIYLARRAGGLTDPRPRLPLDPPPRAEPRTDQPDRLDLPLGPRWQLRPGRLGIGLLAAATLVLSLLLWSPWSTPAWTELPPLPTALEAAGVAEYDGRLWVAGGVSAEKGRALLDTVQVYDPGTRVWRAGPTLPQPLSHAALVSNGHQLYALGGLASSGSVATVYRLDGATGRWTEDTPLPDARGAGAAVWDGARVVFGGGVGTDGQARSDVWVLEGGRWKALGRLSRAREKLAAVSDENGTVWFLGGRDPNVGEPAFGTVDLVQSRSVKAGGDLVAAAGAAAVWWPGQGPCLLAGQTGSGFRADVSCLDTTGGSGGPPPLTSPRAGLGAAVIGNQVYVVGGYDPGRHGSTTVEVAAGDG